ncbi:MAG: hypothetical protein QG635_314, partial [Bacteroidota bacterium]|nr:hypothetical protein [Bacteroidota bacterium]
RSMIINAKQEEFLRLFEPHRKQLSNFARALTRSRTDAQDLVGDTILQAYESFEKIRKKESFKSYLFSIAIRTHKRKLWRKRFFGDYNEEAAEEISSYDTSPEKLTDVRILYETMERLPDKQRQAIALFEISGFSLEEIKEVQGGTLSGVKARLRRGREKLSRLINDKESLLQRNKILKIENIQEEELVFAVSANESILSRNGNE